jgi:TonB family protein
MNRLQKKCFIGSAGIHLLLLVILFVGPAFLSSKEKPQPIDTQTLIFYPSKLIDAQFSGGGNRNAKPPPAAQIASPPPAPAPPKAAAAEKAQELETPKPEPLSKINPDAVDLNPKPKPHRPKINTEIITRASDQAKPKKAKNSDADTKAQERELADEKRRLGQQFARAAARIGESTSSATTIESDFGPGTGGPSYANYANFVRMRYESAWVAPDDTATDDAITKVSVTIANDGTVLSHHITRPSGDSQVDRSVQRTLERVTFIAPFPEGAKDKQRTYIINFNLRAKRGLA